MAMATVKAFVDEQIVRDATRVLDNYGVDMEKAIQLFLDEVIKTNGIDFLDDNLSCDGKIDLRSDGCGDK